MFISLTKMVRLDLASIALSLFFCPGLVNAAIDVEGTVISWPSDGWYQVQRAGDFVTLCEGGSRCEVVPGTYIVINHSTGTRYENITVSTSSTNDPDDRGVFVDGNTIRWLDDGWYQVQDASTHQSLCEGGTSCRVEEGTYTVINLSTGKRFEDIEVGSSDDQGGGGQTKPGHRPVVTGNIISWTESGWVQVQHADTFATVCEGGVQCVVPAGKYHVINHTSGTRYENIAVNPDATDSPPDGSFRLDQHAPGLMLSLAGYQGDQLALLVDVLSHTIIDLSSSVDESLADGQFSTPDSRQGSVVEPIERMRYWCPGGGSLTRELGRMRILESDYSHERDIDGYVFDQCRYTGPTEYLGSGNFTITGRLGIDYRSRNGPRFNDGDLSYTWTNFSLIGPNGLVYEVDGMTMQNHQSSSSTADTKNRRAQFSHFRKLNNGSVAENLTDSRFELTEITHAYDFFQRFRLNLSGVVQGINTLQNAVHIRMDPAFSHTVSTHPDFSNGFDGQVTFSSSEGGTVFFTPNMTGNSNVPKENLLVDIHYTDASGETFSTPRVLLDGYQMKAPNCHHRRVKEDGPVTCTGNGRFVVP